MARRDASDCLFVELTVDAVTRDEAVIARVTPVVPEVGLDAPGFRLATR